MQSLADDDVALQLEIIARARVASPGQYLLDQMMVIPVIVHINYYCVLTVHPPLPPDD